jgi:hypothetical protein
VTGALVFGPNDEIFVGRQAELAAFVDVTARVQEGQPRLVTIEGESGIGKTTLVRRSLASVPGFSVLSARADPAESDLDYGISSMLALSRSSTRGPHGPTGSPRWTGPTRSWPPSWKTWGERRLRKVIWPWPPRT